MKRLLMLCLLLLTSPFVRAQSPAEPARRAPLRSIAHELKESFQDSFYRDFRRHPWSWTVNRVVQVGVEAADTATSCRLASRFGGKEGNPAARIFIGARPDCHKLALLTVFSSVGLGMSESALAHGFDSSCKNDRRWDSIQARTHRRDCFWAVPIGFTLAHAAEGVVVYNNVQLYDREACEGVHFCKP